jgi:16S rRNA G1207 methylase RsmC
MLKDKRVLDMGCGYGLEGIYAMSQSAKMTLF